MPYVLTEQQAKQQLKQLNRDYLGRQTWEKMYGQIDLGTRQAESALTYDYAKAVGEAYQSSIAAEQNIMSSNVGQGFKEQAMYSNEQALQDAYNSYLQNYKKGISEIETSATKATDEVTSALETEAANTKLMQESAYNYLQYLYKNYSDNPMFQEELWKRYLTSEGDTTRLKTWEELSPELYDTKGNLTIKGADFYDQMMNQISQGTYSDTSKYGEITDYYSWLQSENSDLYDWTKSYNPYDYSMYYDTTKGEFVNSKEGSFKTMVGLTSSDQTYSFIERYGGMNEQEVNKMFSKFSDIANTFSTDAYEAKSSINKLKDMTNNIRDLTKELGIEKDINKVIDKSVGGWDNFTNLLDNYISQTKDAGEQSFQHAKTVAMTTLIGTLATAKYAPIVGALVGLVGGVALAHSKDKEQKQLNREMLESAKKDYLAMTQTLLTYVQSQRRQKEIEQYKNY